MRRRHEICIGATMSVSDAMTWTRSASGPKAPTGSKARHSIRRRATTVSLQQHFGEFLCVGDDARIVFRQAAGRPRSRTSQARYPSRYPAIPGSPSGPPYCYQDPASAAISLLVGSLMGPKITCAARSSFSLRRASTSGANRRASVASSVPRFSPSSQPTPYNGLAEVPNVDGIAMRTR